MRTRVSLVCSLVLLAACGDRVIGSAYDMSAADGGPSSAVDRTLADWAKEIAGPWEGPPGSNVTITFTASKQLPRSGTAVIDAYPDWPCWFIPCPSDQDGRPKPPKTSWNVEYWLLRYEGDGALVTMPDLELQAPISFNCVYVPMAPSRLECGPERSFVMKRPDP
jgi:hypothetical protein